MTGIFVANIWMYMGRSEYTHGGPQFRYMKKRVHLRTVMSLFLLNYYLLSISLTEFYRLR